MKQGPALDVLLVRLANIPSDTFSKKTNYEAEVKRFFKNHVALANVDTAEFRTVQKAHGNLILAALWIYEMPEFQGNSLLEYTKFFLGKRLKLYTPYLSRKSFEDPVRAEEFVRLCLDAIGLPPAGEELHAATNRIRAIDSYENAERTRTEKLQSELKAAADKAAAAKVSRE